MAKRKNDEGALFVRYFGPVLDALRKLSGESRFRNQVAWARFYLVREGLMDSSKRGVWR